MELQGSVREAGLADKDAVLAINDVYDGFDYLWDYFDHFIEDPYITPYVYELDGEIVGFVAIHLVDGGQTVVDRAGRVSPKCQEQGVYKQLITEVKGRLPRSSKVRGNAIVFTYQLPKSDNFFKSYRQVWSGKIHGYDFDPRSDHLQDQVKTVLTAASLRQLTHAELSKIIENDRVSTLLFPEGRTIVNWVPFRIQSQNVRHMFGKDTTFVSCIDTDRMDTCSVDILSACSIVRLPKSPFAVSCIIDLLGPTFSHVPVQRHLAAHFQTICRATDKLSRIWIKTGSDFTPDRMDDVLSTFGLQRQHTVYTFTDLYECDL